VKSSALVLVFCGSLLQAQIRLPEYKKVALPNGLTLLLMERHAVPVVSFQVMLRTGSTEDPAGKEGVGGITNDLLRKGTKSKSADQISAQLDFIGATFGSTESFDSLRVTAEFMKKDLATALPLLAEILRQPAFPQSEVEKLLQQRVDEIRSSKDEPDSVINDYYRTYLFGKHPYSRAPGGDEKTLPKLTRADIAGFYESHYVPENIVISVAGDFSAAELEKQLTEQFGSMPKKALAAKPLAAPETVKGRRLLLVDKDDATQTYFNIGNVGIERVNPDRVAVDVVNTLFGGRFTSMINSALRIQSGLTYGAVSRFNRPRQRGPFFIFSYTQNETTEKAMDMALDILKQFHEKGPTEEQIKSSRSYIKGQFGPRVETTDELAGWMADLELYGLDRAEVDDYFARLDKVTLADARRVIQKYYPLEDLTFTVVGKSAEIAKVIKKYAPKMDTISITEPGYGGVK
jgi:predicted Zn-dependent peptidase